jgi:hypothetical membrane protein
MNPILTPISTTYHYFGLAGCIIILIAVAVSALCYRGKRQEAYSALNHFISELGEVGVSPQARVFNGGMILAGISLVPFVVGLGLAIDNLWAKLGIAAGLWAAVSCTSVGLFPMNNLTPHIKAAMSYFRAGLVTVLLFGMAIMFQPDGSQVIPRSAVIASLVAVAAYSSFLILMTRRKTTQQVGENLDPEKIPERPRVWVLAALEWVVFFTTIGWFFSVAVLVRS